MTKLNSLTNLLLTLLQLFLLLTDLCIAQSCPEGCYSCQENQDSGSLECKGCWHDRLGNEGCPPKSFKLEKCLLYSSSGICIICE